MNRRTRSHTWLVALIILIGVVVGAPSDGLADEAATQPRPDPRASVSVDSQMKTIGIIGGISWVSSIEYYRLMNERVRDQLGVCRPPSF